MATYYTQDTHATTYACDCINRLKIELSNKQYFPDEIYCIYLAENGLSPNEIFNKDTMYKKLLTATYCVLEALSNDMNLFRSVETEFGSYGEAYEALSDRIDRLKMKIASTPDNYNEEPNSSCFTYMYRTN